MAFADSPFKREFVKGLLLQFLRGALWVWFGRLIAKGYLTSGQAQYILIALVSFLVAAGSTVASSVIRYVRSLALRKSPANTDPQDIRALGWKILGQIVAARNVDIIPTLNESEH